ncbi:peptidase domain-containing ABC transporter [Vibrio vulnificus]|uniref:peptidase domain-containing ABC transporter n=1 Tax=Vibrio vulnificus TaxID=672 RepID=UPI000CD1318B|nr:peptidase domain-containing ABC transporter [Vibrio vulnificus]POB88714.1 ABC transporter ATP-binding protein [Vibrio vulnificus]
MNHLTGTQSAPQGVTELIEYSGKKSVPVVLQSEITECGLACLTMVASYHGHKTHLNTLRQRANLGANGTHLGNLMEIASTQLDLTSRAVQCSIEELGKLKLPCILHWDLDHFVVLTGVTKKNVFINDPASGKKKLDFLQVGRSFTGIALELTPAPGFKKRKTSQSLKITQLWESITGLKRSLSSLLVLSLVLQATVLLSPYYMQWVIDQVLLSQDKPLLIVLAIGFALLAAIRILVSAFRSWLVLRFNSAINIQMGANLFAHLLRLPISFFERRHIGDIVSRFGSLASVREIISNGVVEAAIDGIMALIILFMMYIYHPILATTVVGFVILAFVVQLAFYSPIKRLTEESISSEAKENSCFLEAIRGIQTIKQFSLEAKRQGTWLNRYADSLNTEIKLGRCNITQEAILEMVTALESIVIIYLGALIVIEGNLTVGMLLAFIAYQGIFVSSVASFVENLLAFKLLDLHLERISDIALSSPEFRAGEQGVSIDNLNGGIRVENLGFRYDQNSDWVFRNLTLEVKAGESIAITGPSGCGKTTFLKVLLGLLQPTEGKIFVDDIDTSMISLPEYRKLFGAVMQDDTLLSGTILDNITLQEPSYSEEHIRNCCEVANIWDDIQSLPMGFHSLVGDMGSNFSGGQLQRLFLARALSRKPKILCLDESTSHLDSYNETQINQSLANLGVTKIMVAHRNETINSADRIISLS